MKDMASSRPPGGERTTVTGGVDLYRDVHKGVRQALFDLTVAAGRLDVADGAEVGALMQTCRRALELLRAHDDHEGQLLLRALVETHAPDLAHRLDEEHRDLAACIDVLGCRADELAATPAADRAPIAHAFYLEAAAVTGTCLEHFDVEERLVMPALAAACDAGHLLRTQRALLTASGPEHDAAGLGAMLTALSPSERSALIDRISTGASPDAIARLRAVAAQVLTPAECAALAIGDP
jgi:hypothetical protein